MEAPAIEPSEFDLVVIGTGFTESVVAAAAAKAGHTVLQLDPSDHYGGSWASLRLEELQALLEAGGVADGAGQQQLLAAAAGIRAGSSQVWRRPGADLGVPRQYSLDLAPKVAYGAGPLIQLLLGSGAHNYLEFKLVQGSYLLDLGASAASDRSRGSTAAPVLRSVPSSRSEVFKDRQLSPLQKRSLMRFLKAAAEALDGEGPLKDAFGEQPIQQLLQAQGLDQQLQQSLLHGVLLADACIRPSGDAGAGASANAAASSTGGEQQLTAAEALERLRLFVQSTGRYGAGTGPFLTPLYGCGELPQAFSRVAAVAGAVQVLRCGISGLSFDEHTFSCDSVELATGQTIRCQQLAASAAALQDWLDTFHPTDATCSTHRCCAVLDAPLVPGEQHSMVAVLPPAAAAVASTAANGCVVRALGLSSSTAVCPPGKYLLYLWVDASGSGSSSSQQQGAAEALLPALAALADTSGLQLQPGSDSTSAGTAGNSALLTAGLAAEQADDSTSGDSSGSKPAVLWAAFFTQDSRQLLPQGRQVGQSGRWPANVALCPGPDSTATFASAVEAAKRCYWQLFPPAAEAEGGVAGMVAAFPLHPSGAQGGEGAGDEAGEGAVGSAAGAAADAESDDEAVAALQAALRQVSTRATDASEGDAAQLLQGQQQQGQQWQAQQLELGDEAEQPSGGGQ